MKNESNSFLESVPKVKGDIAIVAASWHDNIVSKLIEGALSVIHESKPGYSPLLFRVSGAYEVPQMVARLAKSGRYEAIIPLGCIIKGETPHFDLIAQPVFDALMRIGIEFDAAVSNGILTTNSMEQALERAGGTVGNKGSEAAQAALQLAHSFKDIL